LIFRGSSTRHGCCSNSFLGACKRLKQRKNLIQTTLGELVAALTEEAFLVAEDEAEANKLVANMLNDLFARAEAVPNTWH